MTIKSIIAYLGSSLITNALLLLAIEKHGDILSGIISVVGSGKRSAPEYPFVLIRKPLYIIILPRYVR
ncbi:MAG: hypothetical protein GW789_17535 [Ignavibacteria bacterium]|nr:hypothetical protein [Ignavibacteria bacterium]